jgi:hypothetical protein
MIFKMDIATIHIIKRILIFLLLTTTILVPSVFIFLYPNLAKIDQIIGLYVLSIILYLLATIPWLFPRWSHKVINKMCLFYYNHSTAPWAETNFTEQGTYKRIGKIIILLLSCSYFILIMVILITFL